MEPLPQPEATENDWKDYWVNFSSQHPHVFEALLCEWQDCGDDYFRRLTALRDFVIKQHDGHSIKEEAEFIAMESGFQLCMEEWERRRSAPETIERALSAVSPDDNGMDYIPTRKIQNLKVVIGQEEKRAYFIADKSLSFRHQGDKKKKPPQVFLRDLKTHKEQVLVYYAASGSGKTVELAGSSVTRDAHITFVVSVKDPADVYWDDHFQKQAEEHWANSKYKKLRPNAFVSKRGTVNEEIDKVTFVDRFVNRRAAEVALREPLKAFALESHGQLQRLVTAAKAHDETLKIVLAIDEGSRCTRLIRGILRYGEFMGEVVRDLLCDVLEGVEGVTLDVQTSVAGTGLASSTIGSITSYFTILAPYHELDGKEKVYKHNLGILNKKLLVPWSPDFVRINSFDVIQKHLPVVATLMQNGRMASIAIAELGKYNDCDPVRETILVDRIVESFMRSNGMDSLVGREMTRKRQHVAAVALAVHLFRKMDRFKLDVPRDTTKLSFFASDMLFFPLEGQFRTETSIREIVATFGLLEPSDSIIWESQAGTAITPPLQMKTAQQLVAAHMLGIGLESMLEPSWIGFEVMSTHFVNCAIAASVAVLMDKRPNLQEALSCLGFQIDPNATNEDVKKIWEEMKNWRAVAAQPESEKDETLLHSETRQLQAGLEIDSMSGHLLIDKMLHKSIMRLEYPSDEFASPVSCVNYGNSDFPDGFVTFYAVDGSGKEQKWSIMIQAKDYHGKNGIDATKLNDHAGKTQHSALDGVFGKKRLLCVSSSHHSLLTSRKTTKQRDFLPFALQSGSCSLLNKLLGYLKEKRDTESRKQTFAYLCDQEGQVVSAKKQRTE